MGLLAPIDQAESPIAPRRNIEGRTTRPGITGKFYCGSSLGVSCSCCNGSCGPTDGCNCEACMREDIVARHLPEGFMVNREGRTCGIHANGKVYCGAKHIRRISSRADSYCKPEQYGQCAACETLERQLRQRDGRYAGIMAGWKSCNIRVHRAPASPIRGSQSQRARDPLRDRALGIHRVGVGHVVLLGSSDDPDYISDDSDFSAEFVH